MMLSFMVRQAFATRQALVNLATPGMIRSPPWRYRHHVITLFGHVITHLKTVITSFIFSAICRQYRHLPFGQTANPCQKTPDQSRP
ncbi:MAG: hypothetical protein ACK4TJ_13400 [Tabrizicola sp.]